MDPLDGGFRPKASAITHKWERQLQIWLDKSVPHMGPRWALFVFVAGVYFVRCYLLHGFYIVTYGIGIYNLNLLIGFLSPQEAEFKPFVRRLPEFKFWLQSIKSFLVGFCMTFFSFFDVPVFWPILLMYWLLLLFVTMKRQIKHMIKHRYLPFSHGKTKYKPGGEKAAAAGAAPGAAAAGAAKNSK